MSGKSADEVFGLWFKDQGDPGRNPMKLAQSAMRPPLPARFYASAEIEEKEGVFFLTLDGRRARTPAKSPISVPARAAAMLLAAEWNDQKDVINPADMHVTRIVNAAIDHVGVARQAVAEEIVKYGGSDLLCYRAADPDRLVALQRMVWDPIVNWARHTLAINLNLAEGVIFVPQSRAAMDRISEHVAGFEDPIALSALHVLTTLSGSVILSLAVAKRHLQPTEAYDASELEADFTSEVWGSDEEALYRRRRRETEFKAAAALLLSVA